MIVKKKSCFYWGLLALLIFMFINVDARAASDDSYIAQKNLDQISTVLLKDGTLNISGKGKVTEKYVFPELKDRVKKISISDGITVLDANVFYAYPALESVTISNTVNSIGTGAFKNCENLSKITISDKLLNSLDVLQVFGNTKWYRNNRYTVTFNSNGGSGNMKSIAVKKGAKLTLPLNEFTPPQAAIFDAWKVGSTLYKPNDIIAINDNTNVDAFWKKITGKQIQEKKSVYISWKLYDDGLLIISGKGVLERDYDLTKYAEKIREVVIEEGITSIPRSTPEQWENLESLTLPNSIKSIESGAFFGCRKLNKIIMSDNLSSRLDLGSIFITEAPGDKLVVSENYELDKDGTLTIKSGDFDFCSFLWPEDDYALPFSFSIVKTLVFEEDVTKISFQPYEIWETLCFANYNIEKIVNRSNAVIDLLEGYFEPFNSPRCCWCYEYDLKTPIKRFSKGTVVRVDEPLYHVYFDGNGAEGSMKQHDYYDDVSFEYHGEKCGAVLPECGFDVPDGKYFDGWEINGKKYREGDFVVFNNKNEVTAKAIWADAPALVFDANGGSGTMPKMPGKWQGYFDDGFVVTVPECTFKAPEGKVFDYWEADEYGYIHDVSVNEVMYLYDNVKLTAIWKDADSYIGENYEYDKDGTLTITGGEFDLKEFLSDENELPFDFDDVKTLVINEDVYGVIPWANLIYSCDVRKITNKSKETIYLYGLSEDPYYCPNYFWCYENDLKMPVQSINQGTVVRVDDKLYHLHFDGNGAEGNMEQIDFENYVRFERGGEKIGASFPECKFITPEGKYFKGWEVDSIIYNVGDLVDFDKSPEVTAKALWGDKPILSFDANGGSGEMPSRYAESQHSEDKSVFSVTIPECTFEPPYGMTFDHWEGYLVEALETYPNRLEYICGDTTISAVWRYLPSVTFYSDNAMTQKEVIFADANNKCTLPENMFTTPEGKYFDGWKIDSKTYKAGEVVDFEESIELIAYAVWKDIPKEPEKEEEKPSEKAEENTKPAEKDDTTEVIKPITEEKPVEAAKEQTKQDEETIDKSLKKSKISNAIATKKAITISWKKQTKGVKGYEIQYSTDKKFEKKVKTITVKKNKTTSKTIKKLKSKTKYYIRIRTFTRKNGKKSVSDWSKTKAVKTK